MLCLCKIKRKGECFDLLQRLEILNQAHASLVSFNHFRPRMYACVYVCMYVCAPRPLITSGGIDWLNNCGCFVVLFYGSCHQCHQ